MFQKVVEIWPKNLGFRVLCGLDISYTSEGDDDVEEGRDSANRSSEYLRKSRMGFQQGHPLDNSLNGNELLNDHVEALCSSLPSPPANFKFQEDLISGSSLKAPKSFSSLSTFRSKGSYAKPR